MSSVKLISPLLPCLCLLRRCPASAVAAVLEITGTRCLAQATVADTAPAPPSRAVFSPLTAFLAPLVTVWQPRPGLPAVADERAPAAVSDLWRRRHPCPGFAAPILTGQR